MQKTVTKHLNIANTMSYALMFLCYGLGIKLMLIIAQDATKTPIWIIQYGAWSLAASVPCALLLFMKEARKVVFSILFLTGVILAAVMIGGKKIEGGFFLFPFFMG